MRFVIATVLAFAALRSTVRAQAPAAGAPTPDVGYAEVVAQSAFGNVTSQSFGGEIGYALRPGFEVFVDAGYVRDASPASLGTAAQALASGLTTIVGPTTYQVKEPVTFGVAGLKYIFPLNNSRIGPYVSAGGGVARAKKDVSFSTPSGDISQFATLGTDLSGTETAGMLSLGVGVGLSLSHALIVDLQYRYGRVFTSDGLNINRAGVGFGVRF